MLSFLERAMHCFDRVVYDENVFFGKSVLVSNVGGKSGGMSAMVYNSGEQRCQTNICLE